nr:hypothetical protein [Tanacetum cinerariifolium]
MTTLADKVILLGDDNRPPMLEKNMYDSWKSQMELYMMNRQHERMILKSVENGPLLWPSIEENGVTRPKKYSGLSAIEAIQADCDVKETNIILQGLPLKVYALVINHKVSKELWKRIQLFMQGTSLTKQERELPTWHLDVYGVGFDGMVMFLLWGEEFCRGVGEEVKGMMNSRFRREGVLVCVISRVTGLGERYKRGNRVRGVSGIRD